MSLEEVVEKIQEDFVYYGITVPADDITEKCAQLCNKRNLTTDEFLEQWISFSMFSSSNKDGTTPTISSLNSFERYLSEQEGKSKNKENRNTTKSKPDPANSYANSPSEKPSAPKRQREENDDESNASKRKKEYEKKVDNIPFSPFRNKTNDKNIEENLSKSITLTKEEEELAIYLEDFSARKDRLKVVESFGSKDLLAKATFTASGADEHIIIEPLEDTKTLTSDTFIGYDVRTMKNLCMDRKIDTIGKYLMDKNNLKQAEPFIAMPYRPELGVVYGQIVKNTTGKMDSTSVMLESSNKLNQGAAVNLELHSVNVASLFPGQVVAMKASKGRPGCIIPETIYSDALLDLPEKIPELTNAGALQIVVASGPFTMSNNLTYEPLMELMKYVHEHKPHVLILTGPFLDVSQENITKETFTVSYQSYFEVLINGLMEKLNEKQCNTQVVVVSSCRDLHHENVYPTPPYDLEEQPKNLHFMPDPSIISINGIQIGITSTDILFHLNKEEFFKSRSGQTSNRMSRIVKHIISQQCFYPLSPPSKEICMDVHLFKKHGYFKETPHIVIMPSNLRYFVKDIDRCIVVNPERLSKGCAGGTFARMEIHPNQLTKSATNNVVCEILKI